MGTVHLSQTSPSRTVQARVGEDLVLELDENPTTGYTWTAESADADALQLATGSYRAGDGAFAGAAGKRQFHFIATMPGEVQLSFRLARPWEQDAAAARITVAVQVRS